MTNVRIVMQLIRFIGYGIAWDYWRTVAKTLRSKKCLDKGLVYSDKRWEMMMKQMKDRGL